MKRKDILLNTVVTVVTILLIITLVIYFIPEVNNYFDNTTIDTIDDPFDFTTKGNLVNDSELDSLEDSGITGSEYSFDETYYPYYANLSSDQKTLYKQIYANIISLEESIVPLVDLGIDDVSLVIESIYNDHPELFYLDNTYSYKYTQNKICVQITLVYNYLASNLSYYQELFDNAVSSIISVANSYSTAYEKEKYVHDALIELITYNENADINQTSYSALVLKETVCSGYAKAFQYIMQELGIPCYFVTGTSSGYDHAWNIIELDGEYYNVDLTWDDTNPISYTYFNVADTTFNKTHTRSMISSSLPTCTGSTYTYQKDVSTNTPSDIPEQTKPEYTEPDTPMLDEMEELQPLM